MYLERQSCRSCLPPAKRARLRRRGIAALRELLNEPERTEKAFEVFQFLDGDSEEKMFQRFLSSPDAARLLTTRPCLLAHLSDRKALLRLPAQSFGRAYVDYLDANRFEPGGLFKLKCELLEKARREGEVFPELDPMRDWMRDRTIFLHDLWHVLTGYGTDELGEGALLYFTHAQVGGRANAIFITGIAIRTATAGEFHHLPYLAEAWRRGRRAVWLTGLPYEDLLPLPLEEVRRRAGIVPADIAHRNGIRAAWISGGRTAMSTQ
jgi:ubiquinone biosynthesis protein COQ4